MVPINHKNNYLPFLTADTSLYLPQAYAHYYITTSSDVIHSFCLPHFHIKLDSVPGVLNGGYFVPLLSGYFYGQCSELCGVDHSFMPINLIVTTYSNYLRWLSI